MMLLFNELIQSDVADDRVSLTFHERIKGRLRITTDGGADAGIQIDRGQVLENGQKLKNEQGFVLEVLAKPELVSVAFTESASLFARACYHVGNRHAEVQIGDNQLIYLHDHVMDDMLTLLGMRVSAEHLPFHPEKGAYASGHSHAHHPHDH